MTFVMPTVMPKVCIQQSASEEAQARTAKSFIGSKVSHTVNAVSGNKIPHSKTLQRKQDPTQQSPSEEARLRTAKFFRRSKIPSDEVRSCTAKSFRWSKIYKLQITEIRLQMADLAKLCFFIFLISPFLPYVAQSASLFSLAALPTEILNW